MKKIKIYRKPVFTVLLILTAVLTGCTNKTGSGGQSDTKPTMNMDSNEDFNKENGNIDSTDIEDTDSKDLDNSDTNEDKDNTKVIPYDFEITFKTYENTIKSEDGSLVLLNIKNIYPNVTSKNNPSAAEKINMYYENLFSKDAIENKDISNVDRTADLPNETGDETDGEMNEEPDEETDTTDISDIIEWAKEDYQMRLEPGSSNMDSWTPYSDETTLEVSLANENILSFIGYSYMYTGGAHGNYVVYGDTFDSQTGDKLSFADLTEDEAAARAFVEEQITLQAEKIQQDYAEGKSELALFDEYKEYIPDVLTEDSWYLTEEGFEVVANVYLLAPYAAGDIHFKIPYDQADFLKEKYKK